MTSNHVLSNPVLPDRYETLVNKLGHSVANLLVAPSKAMILDLEALAQDANTRGEGLLVPIYGESGAGKTTLVMNLSQWLPAEFTGTLSYEGALDYDDLCKQVEAAAIALPSNNKKIIPINIDHRESNPPAAQELAALKRFLRTSPVKVPCVVFWPETSLDVAQETSNNWEKITGSLPVKMPLRYEVQLISGPNFD